MALSIALLLFVLFQAVQSFTCQWSVAKRIGAVDTPIREDSGLAISRRFPNRVYHVNDSGDMGRFFTTDFTGGHVGIVNVIGFDPRDVEDLALGPCSPEADCLFIGDTGDNSTQRKSIELVVIEEVQNFRSQVTPRYRVQMKYPDRSRDSEALAVHPDGTVYVLTKGETPQLYRLRKEQWMNAKGRIQTLELVAGIDFEKLGGAAAAIDGRFPTAMDISPDGKRVLVLTYRNVFELQIDLSKPLPPVSTWKAGQHYRRVPIEVLSQQEAIAFTPDGKSLIYDTEKNRGDAPMMRCDCR